MEKKRMQSVFIIMMLVNMILNEEGLQEIDRWLLLVKISSKSVIRTTILDYGKNLENIENTPYF
jgi:hypothetical protein